MTGKQKCKILKEIRRQIAEANEIRFVIEECTHKGKCKGTCPRCEWEVRELEKALEKRRLSGKKVALAGISAGMIVSSATACSPIDTIEKAINKVIGNELEGDMVLEGVDVVPPDTLQPLTGEVEPLMGDPVPESAVDIPGEVVEETTLGEVIVEVDGILAPPEPETDSEEEDFPEIAGVPLYEDEYEKEYVLEGDVAFPHTEATQ